MRTRKLLIILVMQAVILPAYSPGAWYAPPQPELEHEFIGCEPPPLTLAEYLQPLIDAIYFVESSCDSMAVNAAEEAVGGLQIRPIRLRDYNNRTGKSYVREDLFSLEISKEIFVYYAGFYDPQNWETIAKRWNGSGPMTITYWNKVKAVLNERGTSVP